MPTNTHHELLGGVGFVGLSPKLLLETLAALSHTSAVPAQTRMSKTDEFKATPFSLSFVPPAQFSTRNPTKETTNDACPENDAQHIYNIRLKI